MHGLRTCTLYIYVCMYVCMFVEPWKKLYGKTLGWAVSEF